MASLSAADLRAVLDYTRSTLRVEDDAQLPALLGGLARLVGSESATLTHLHLRTQDEVALPWPLNRIDRAVLPAYAQLGHTHPLRAPLLAMAGNRVTRLPPLRLSDVLSNRLWRDTRLHREVMPTTSDQLCLPLSFRGWATRAVTLSRSEGRFTDRERDLLAACAEHLRAAVGRTRPGGHRWVRFVPAAGQAPEYGPLAVPALSVREREVLTLVAEGATDAQIARRLGLRPATVSKHLHRIYTRHNVRNRAEAVRLLHDRGAGARGDRLVERGSSVRGSLST
jgi:DNA-binding CsgD family transcriptional regulator